ncbi:MAG: hypothetical protein IKG22_13815 [Atopobiaceae bacterium]|nr:hypothetical protein [Atopobiaceae bacterium]
MVVATKIVALAELLDGGFSKQAIRRAFSRFSCERDPDVSLFLKAHAIQNEATGASRTYLALSSDALDEDRLEVLAFVTVAVSVTDYTGIDLGRRLQIMGRVPGVESANFFPGYLVAQLARDDCYTHDDFDASRLLPFAGDVIAGAIAVVGGRFAYIDCRDELVGYYKRQDYEPLYYDEGRDLHKLVKPLF